ncbi:MAG: hypothetical protein EXR02_05235 [Rhodospirillales bacterium]|nr:hypothetical protein [Rhodospirillales bacterium]
MLRRLYKIVPSILACVAVLFWGLAGAAPAAHDAIPETGSQVAQNHTDHQGAATLATGGDHHNGVAATTPADADNTAGGMDHCSLSGCSFAAVMPLPSGAVIHARASAPVFAPGDDVPESGAAPPLRPPRLS